MRRDETIRSGLDGVYKWGFLHSACREDRLESRLGAPFGCVGRTPEKGYRGLLGLVSRQPWFGHRLRRSSLPGGNSMVMGGARPFLFSVVGGGFGLIPGALSGEGSNGKRPFGVARSAGTEQAGEDR